MKHFGTWWLNAAAIVLIFASGAQAQNSDFTTAILLLIFGVAAFACAHSMGDRA